MEKWLLAEDKPSQNAPDRNCVALKGECIANLACSKTACHTREVPSERKGRCIICQYLSRAPKTRRRGSSRNAAIQARARVACNIGWQHAHCNLYQANKILPSPSPRREPYEESGITTETTFRLKNQFAETKHGSITLLSN